MKVIHVFQPYFNYLDAYINGVVESFVLVSLTELGEQSFTLIS